MHLNHPLLRSVIVIMTVFIGQPIHALSSDQRQPMEVEANQADIDDKKGVSVYTGNVIVVQGSMRITADKMTVHTQGNKLQKVVAIGQPATFEQLPDGKQDKIHGLAQRMEFYADSRKIILIQEAQLSQGGNSFRSNRITYDIDSDKVLAGKPAGGDRVRITIQPQNNE